MKTQYSDDRALILFLGFWLGTQHSTDCFIKHIFQSLLGESRTLEILDGTNLFGHGQALGRKIEKNRGLDDYS